MAALTAAHRHLQAIQWRAREGKGGVGMSRLQVRYAPAAQTVLPHRSSRRVTNRAPPVRARSPDSPVLAYPRLEAKGHDTGQD
eukprot:3425451-Pleurochrysis_carterae.AAC.1